MDVTMAVILTIFALMATFTGVGAGSCFAEKKHGVGILYLLWSLAVSWLFAGGLYFSTGKMTLHSIVPVDDAVYVVLKKVPDGQGAFLIFLDTKNDNERVAHLAVYPPDGYAETVLSDGRTVLAVAGKQIVVGDPDKADFVPAIKSVPPPKG